MHVGEACGTNENDPGFSGGVAGCRSGARVLTPQALQVSQVMPSDVPTIISRLASPTASQPSQLILRVGDLTGCPHGRAALKPTGKPHHGIVLESPHGPHDGAIV